MQRVVIIPDPQIVLVDGVVFSAVSAEKQVMSLPGKPVQGYGAFLARGDGVNCEFGTRLNVAAGEDVQFGCLIRYRVDGDGFVNIASRASRFIFSGTDTSAYGREGVFLLDQLQGIHIFPQSRELDIALYGDMGGAQGLAGRRSRFGSHIFPGQQIVELSFVLAPDVIVLADFLPQLDGVHRANIDALAAGGTLFLVNACHKVRTHHVGRIHEPCGSECQAAFGMAVANEQGVVWTVHIRYLVDIPHLFGSVQNIVGFFLCDPSGPVGLDTGFGKLANLNTPFPFEVFTGLSNDPRCSAALAPGYGKTGCIFFNPITQLFDLDFPGFGIDRFLYGHGDDQSGPFGDKLCGILNQPIDIVNEVFRDFRVSFNLRLIHHHQFQAAGRENRQHPPLFAVDPCVFKDADIGHFFDQPLDVFRRAPCLFRYLFHGVGRADFHAASDLDHIVGEQIFQGLVLRRFLGTIRIQQIYVLDKFCQIFSHIRSPVWYLLYYRIAIALNNKGAPSSLTHPAAPAHSANHPEDRSGGLP